MNPGDYRYSIDVYNLTNIVDVYGSAQQAYTLAGSLKCNIKQLTGNKDIVNEGIFNTSTISFETYFRKYINTESRIYYNYNYYQINEIKTIGFNQFLILSCELLQDNNLYTSVISGVTVTNYYGTSGTSGGGSGSGGTGTSGTSGTGSPGTSGTSGNSTSGTSGKAGSSGTSSTSGIIGSGVAKITVSQGQPQNPSTGDLWIDTN